MGVRIGKETFVIFTSLIFVVFIFAVIILITEAWLSVMLVGEKLGKWRNKKLGGEIKENWKINRFSR